MANRLMQLKKIAIPLMLLVIVIGQLAGCAAKTGDKIQESRQSSDASEVIDAGGTQFVSDSGGDAGLTANQVLEEISHDELIAVFEQVYKVSKEIDNSDSEETIQSELLMIEITAASMNRSLPSDYEAQYREWRPSVVQQDTQTTETTQQNQQTQSQQSQWQSQEQDQQQYDPSVDRGTVGDDGFFTPLTEDKAYTNIADPYDGYGEVTIGYGGSSQSKPSGGEQQTQQPSGTQSQEDKNRADNEAAGQGLAGMDAWATEHSTGENHPELRPGSTVDENGNITNPNTAVNMS